MSLFKLIEEISIIHPEDAFNKLKKLEGFSIYNKSEAPYFLQPEGRIYTLFSHDFYFINGDCVTYTAKEGEPAAVNGYWDCYDANKEVWFSYQDQEFVIHETHVDQRRHKPNQHFQRRIYC